MDFPTILNKSNNYFFQVALASFYDNDGNEDDINLDMDDDSTAAPAFPPGDDRSNQPTVRSTTDDAKSKEKAAARPRIATIHNMNRSSDEDEPQGQVLIDDPQVFLLYYICT